MSIFCNDLLQKDNTKLVLEFYFLFCRICVILSNSIGIPILKTGKLCLIVCNSKHVRATKHINRFNLAWFNDILFKQ